MSSDGEESANRLESTALAVIFAVISVGLLLALGIATRPGAENAHWWTRPALAPGVALLLLVLANLITLWRDFADLRANPAKVEERAEAWDKFTGWLRPLEFLGYYAAYVFSIQHLGYFASSLIFILGLLWRVGLTAPRWILAGVLAAVAMVGVFRIGLGVWMPAPELYDLFPDAVRTALIRWF